MGIAREALLTGLAIFAVTATAVVAMYRSANYFLWQQIQGELQQLASVAAAGIDPAVHARLARAGQLGGEDYRRVSLPLLRIRRAVPELSYAYTLRPTPSGLRFGVDTDFYLPKPAGADPAPPPKPGDPYPDAPEAALEVARGGKARVSTEPYTDRWGTFLSGYAPVRDGSGRVAAVVGVDFSLATLRRNLLPLRLALAISLLMSAALGTLAGAARWRSLQSRRRSLQGFERAAERARRAAAEAEAANRSKDQFLATMSHEIRTPLNGVLGLTSIVLDTPLTTGQRDCLKTLQTTAGGLLGLLNDILDFARIEAGSMVLEPSTFPPRPLLEASLSLQQEAARARGIKLLLDPDPSLPSSLRTDRQRLAQILALILELAVKQGQAAGVRLAVRAVDRSDGAPADLEFVVEGRGTDATAGSGRGEVLPQPLGPPGSPGSEIQGADGLRLLLCGRLAEALGGNLQVGGPGASARFVLTLPTGERRDGPAAADASGGRSTAEGPPVPPASETPQPPQSVPQTTIPEGAVAVEEPPELPDPREGVAAFATRYPLRILVAEDSAINRRVCQLMLRRLGYEASFAVDGEEAVERQRRLDPDLILMDIRMPGVDGLEAARRIRSATGREQRPWIVALTADPLPATRTSALEAGMDDFIAKPIDPDQLAAVLRRGHEGLGSRQPVHSAGSEPAEA